MISLALLVALQQASPVPAQSTAFAAAPVVADALRLAISPKVDGKLDPEEWDPLTTSPAESYFQWEPGRLHCAAKLPVGQDMVASFDLKGDGWLQGSDNLEVRVKWTGAAAEMSVRRLDASRPEGPVWIDAGNLAGSAKVAGSVEGDKWIAEVTLADPGLGILPIKPGSVLGVRVDGVPPTDTFAEPFLPRLLANVTLTMERGSNLPTGLQWKPEFRGRTVMPGEAIRIRLTFNGSDLLSFKRIDMRTEGLAKDETSTSGIPFPAFDRKNRAFVDYVTTVNDSAMTGWRVLRGTLTDSGGKSTVVQTSYEIAPVVQFDFETPKKLHSSSEPQTVRLAAFVRSNTKKRVNGIFRVGSSQVFKVESGDAKPFVIYNARGSKRQVFEITIPAGFKGSLPVTVFADVGVETHQQTIWLDVP